MKKMRKAAAGIAAAAVVMSMSMNTLAAGSIVGSIDMTKVESDKGKVELKAIEPEMFEEELQEIIEGLNKAPAEATLKEAFELVLKEGEELPKIELFSVEGLEKEDIDLDELKFLSPVMNLEITEAEPTEEDPVKVTFVANNVTDDIEVYVLHYCIGHKFPEHIVDGKVYKEHISEEGIWELLETELESENEVSAYFHSAGGPVALVYMEKTEDEEGETDTTEVAP